MFEARFTFRSTNASGRPIVTGAAHGLQLRATDVAGELLVGRSAVVADITLVEVLTTHLGLAIIAMPSGSRSRSNKKGERGEGGKLEAHFGDFMRGTRKY